MFQLIQYKPTTQNVYKKPLLITPPWINKFYILDLRQENSLIKCCVNQGHTVFVMSWVNPDIDRCRDDLRGAFCNHVSLYASIAAFEAAEIGRSGAIAIPLSEAFVLARQRNRQRYPEIAL